MTEAEYDVVAEQISDLQAEVDGLNKGVEMLTLQAIKFRDMCVTKDQLISELADALERIPVVLTPPDRELVERAREATHGEA